MIYDTIKTCWWIISISKFAFYYINLHFQVTGYSLWRSHFRAFHLYSFGTLDNQCMGSLDVLRKGSVVLPLLLIILVSKNFQSFTLMVKFIFERYWLKFSKSKLCSFFFFFVYNIINKNFLKLRFFKFNYIVFCPSHMDTL